MLDGGTEEKHQNINKIKLFISKTIKMYTKGFERESLFSTKFSAWFYFLQGLEDVK